MYAFGCGLCGVNLQGDVKSFVNSELIVYAISMLKRNVVIIISGIVAAMVLATGITLGVVLSGDSVPTYKITYSAGTGGTITGKANQKVKSGKNGTAVTAQANAGYAFDQWSDGVLTATRKETNVTAKISVTAQFSVVEGNTTHFVSGLGTVENPYKISTREQFENIGLSAYVYQRAYYELINDIDFGAEEYKPIYNVYSFYGNLNGRGYKISNMFINIDNSTEGEYGITSRHFGLFGQVDQGASISNLVIEDALISDTRPHVIESNGYAVGYVNHVGILAGSSHGNIENVSVSGNITSINNITWLGGLIGHASDTSAKLTPRQITDCSANVDISIENNFNSDDGPSVGGLIGQANYNYSNLIIKNCYATGSIIANTSHYITAGGLVGTAYGNQYGFAGYYDRAFTIQNSYSLVDINVDVDVANLDVSARNAGGLIGYYYDNTTIENSYAAGRIDAGSTLGSTLGGIVAGGFYVVTVTNCHWLHHDDGDTTYAIGRSGTVSSDDGATKYTDITEMHGDALIDILNAGLETPVWVAVEDGLPILAWQASNIDN